MQCQLVTRIITLFLVYVRLKTTATVSGMINTHISAKKNINNERLFIKITELHRNAQQDNNHMNTRTIH